MCNDEGIKIQQLSAAEKQRFEKRNGELQQNNGQINKRRFHLRK